MNSISDLSLAYIAGFLDGDGSVIAQLVIKSDYVLGYQLRVSVSFIQSSRRQDFLVDLQQELGCGTIRHRNDGISELNIVGRDNLTPLLTALLPYLRLKQKQAELVLAICVGLDEYKNDAEKFLQLCELCDQVAALNDSKKRKNNSEMVRNHLTQLGLLPKK